MEVLLNIKDGDWTIPIFLALEMKPSKGWGGDEEEDEEEVDNEKIRCIIAMIGFARLSLSLSLSVMVMVAEKKIIFIFYISMDKI